MTLEKPKLQIADEDIVVYKCVEIRYKRILFGLVRKVNYYSSLFQLFKYLPNKIYNTELDEFSSNSLKRYFSRRGFYSYENREHGNVKCIIPKGAKYYRCVEVFTNEVIYHSDKIKIVKPI